MGLRGALRVGLRVGLRGALWWRRWRYNSNMHSETMTAALMMMMITSGNVCALSSLIVWAAVGTSASSEPTPVNDDRGGGVRGGDGSDGGGGGDGLGDGGFGGADGGSHEAPVERETRSPSCLP